MEFNTVRNCSYLKSWYHTIFFIAKITENYISKTDLLAHAVTFLLIPETD